MKITVPSRLSQQTSAQCISLVLESTLHGCNTHHLLLLIWSPNPGVSVMVSFNLTAFSSITVDPRTNGKKWPLKFMGIILYDLNAVHSKINMNRPGANSIDIYVHRIKIPIVYCVKVDRKHHIAMTTTDEEKCTVVYNTIHAMHLPWLTDFTLTVFGMIEGDPVDAVRLSRPLNSVFTMVDFPRPVAPAEISCICIFSQCFSFSNGGLCS